MDEIWIHHVDPDTKWPEAGCSAAKIVRTARKRRDLVKKNVILLQEVTEVFWRSEKSIN